MRPLVKSKCKKGNKGPALPALTAPVGDSIVADMLAMKSSSRSIDGNTHALAADQDGASATTGGGESFNSNNQHPTGTTSNDGRELNQCCWQ